MQTNKPRNNSQSDSVKTSLYWNTLIRIPVQAVTFVISIVVARMLNPEDFGIIGIVMMLLGYANMFTNLGFNQAIVQKDIRDKRTLDSIFTIDFLISTLLAALFYITSGQVAKFFKTPQCESVLKVMTLVFVITSFYAVPHGILRRDLKFKTFALIETSQNLSTSALTLILAILNLKYWALAFGQLVPLAFASIVFAIKAKWYPSIFYSHRQMKEVFDFGIWNFLRAQLVFVTQHIDKFFVGKWLGAFELGLYDKSKSLAGMLNNAVLININAVMFSNFSKNKNFPEQLQEDLKKALVLQSLIIFPVNVWLIVISPYFVHALLGSKWDPMILPFQVILVGSTFRNFDGLITAMNIGAGKNREQTLRVLIAVVALAISCLFLLKLGIKGVAWSFVVFSIILIALGTLLTKSFIQISWKDIFRSVRCGLLSSLIMGLLVWSISFFIQEHSIVNFVILSVIASVIYLALLVACPGEDVRQIRNEVLLDLKRKVGLDYD